jgi:hypothetical protein
MTWVTIIFCNFCSGILCIILARKKHRALLPWFLLALPVGVLALFALLALPARPNLGAGENPDPPSH